MTSKKYHFEELFEIILNQNSNIKGDTSTNTPNSDAGEDGVEPREKVNKSPDKRGKKIKVNFKW